MIKKIYHLLFNSDRVSIFKTLLINFRSLPLAQAIHLPIYVYRGTILRSMGYINIDSPIKTGMIQIGIRNFYAAGRFQLINTGTITFRGGAILNGGTLLNNCGSIDIGADVILGENLTILTINRLSIGRATRVAFGTVIIDTDFHNVINTDTGRCKRSYMPIVIGDYNWIGNRSTLTKGVITPDFTITASTSYLNRDYSNLSKYTLLAGSPAKSVLTNIRRIYSDDTNKMIMDYFDQHPEKMLYQAPSVQGDDAWDHFCIGGEEAKR